MPRSLCPLLRRAAIAPAAPGFTLLENLVIIAIVGILAAIAAPSWLSFVAQQRLGRANEQIVQAIRQAQAEAKRTGTYREVRFDFTADPPRFAIVPVTTAFNPNLRLTTLPAAQVTTWEPFGQGNIPANTLTLTDNNPNGNSLIFSPRGTVASPNLAPSNPAQLPYSVTVALRNNPANRRCVRVESVLGAISQGKNNACL